MGKIKATGSVLDVGMREDSQVPSLPNRVGDGALHRESSMSGGPGVGAMPSLTGPVFLTISLISALSNRVTSFKILVPSPCFLFLVQQFLLL